MWLGLSAIIVAFTYALIKFLTSAHMRRLRDQHMHLLQEVKRERKRLQAVEGKLHVQRSQRGSAQQKLANARRFKDDLFSRLRLELPSNLAGELNKCVNRHPIPEPEGVRTAHELRLVDKVTDALSALTLLVVELAPDPDDAPGARVALGGDLVERLKALGVRFTGPAVRRGAPDEAAEVLTTAVDDPAQAVDLLVAFGEAHAEHVAQLRGVLISGVTVTDFDKEHVNRLFARTLHGTRALLDEAEAGQVVINQKAHDLLGARPGIDAKEGPDLLWILPLGVRLERAAAEGTDVAGTPPERSGATIDPDTGSLSVSDSTSGPEETGKEEPR
jgi:hypothetical protein